MIAVAPTPAPCRRLRVLIADDDGAILRLASILLGDQCDLTLVSSVADGIEKIASSTYDVIITDMIFQDDRHGLDGADLCAAARDRSPDTLRVVLSAYSDIDMYRRAINVGQSHMWLDKVHALRNPSDMIADIADQVAKRAASRPPLPRMPPPSDPPPAGSSTALKDMCHAVQGFVRSLTGDTSTQVERPLHETH